MRQLLVLSNWLFVDRRRTCGESVTQWQFSTFGSETQLSDELALRSLHRLCAVCCSRSKKGKCAVCRAKFEASALIRASGVKAPNRLVRVIPCTSVKRLAHRSCVSRCRRRQT